MEEITFELDDETADWLNTIAAAQNKSISAVISELIRELRASPVATERSSD